MACPTCQGKGSIGGGLLPVVPCSNQSNHPAKLEAMPLAGRFLSPYSKERWKTADGDTYQLAFMKTSHMFYAFRMLYDMVAKRHGWPTMRLEGEGRQANHKLQNDQVALHMAWFATDIMLRDDLELELAEQFAAMLGRISKLVNGGKNGSR